jgi:hypothetical protein
MSCLTLALRCSPDEASSAHPAPFDYSAGIVRRVERAQFVCEVSPIVRLLVVAVLSPHARIAASLATGKSPQIRPLVVLRGLGCALF